MHKMYIEIDLKKNRKSLIKKLDEKNEIEKRGACLVRRRVT